MVGVLSCKAGETAKPELNGVEVAEELRSVRIAVDLGAIDPRPRMLASCKSGVSRGMTLFQIALISATPKLWPAGGGRCGAVYFRTMSAHLLKTASGICRRQLTALKKRRSLLLISTVLSPDILLHAFAE